MHTVMVDSITNSPYEQFFLICLFIYFVAGHLDIKKYILGSYNKPV
jgi:hypothetical protein